jgi:hypothetical protein
MEGAYFEELGLKYGARIVAIDRPGYGLSDQSVGRKVRDWAADVECLTAELGLKSYAVLVSIASLYEALQVTDEIRVSREAVHMLSLAQPSCQKNSSKASQSYAVSGLQISACVALPGCIASASRMGGCTARSF